jgi:20S proteasome alpha/beta subunit
MIQHMTCCVAALCADRKAIVLAADKMIGMVGMESEPDISKIFHLHKDWRVMLAGNNVSAAFDIIDHAKKAFSRKKAVGIDEAVRIMSGAFREKRAEEAEALHLAPIGWTLRKLNSPSSQVLPESVRLNLIYQIQSYSLPISLLVVGFDGSSRGHIFSIEDGPASKGIPQRHDLPGYYSIGSGSFGALYIGG